MTRCRYSVRVRGHGAPMISAAGMIAASATANRRLSSVSGSAYGSEKRTVMNALAHDSRNSGVMKTGSDAARGGATAGAVALIARSALAQFEALDLPGGGLGQFRHELEPPRIFVRRKAGLAVFQQR